MLPTAVVLDGAGDASVAGQGHMTFLHSDHPEDENSFEQPTKASRATRTHQLCSADSWVAAARAP